MTPKFRSEIGLCCGKEPEIKFFNREELKKRKLQVSCAVCGKLVKRETTQIKGAFELMRPRVLTAWRDNVCDKGKGGEGETLMAVTRAFAGIAEIMQSEVSEDTWQFVAPKILDALEQAVSNPSIRKKFDPVEEIE